MRSLVALGAAIISFGGVLTVAGPAAATSATTVVGGSLSCPPGQVVWIVERSSAGVTTLAVDMFLESVNKQDWSTTRMRTGLRSTVWSVSSTGSVDLLTTRAYCGL